MLIVRIRGPAAVDDEPVAVAARWKLDHRLVCAEPLIETIENCGTMLGDELKSVPNARRDEILAFRRRLDEMQSFLGMVNSLFNVVVKAGKSRTGSVVKALAKLDRGMSGRSMKPARSTPRASRAGRSASLA